LERLTLSGKGDNQRGRGGEREGEREEEDEAIREATFDCSA